MNHLPKILSSEILGPYARFKLQAMRTRFGDVEWFLIDAEARGGRDVIAQGTEATCRAAVGVQS